MASAGIGAYQEAQAREMSQGQLILLMFTGAIRFLDRAIEAGADRAADMNAHAAKAGNILLELMASLNFSEGGEMAHLLMRTYRHLFARLQAARISDDPVILKQIRDEIAELEDAWRQVIAGAAEQVDHRDRGRITVA